MEEIKKIIANAAVNAELENKKLSEETIKMIEECLKTENGSLMFQLYLKTHHGQINENVGNDSSKNSKYCYGNGVLKNKKNIKDLELFHIIESDNAAFYQSQVVSGRTDYKFSFDKDSYLDLHKRLFFDVYSFAGEIRDEFIYKSCMPYFNAKTPFCLPQCIKENLISILNEMKYKLSTINSRDDLIKYLAYYYGELNMIHPFREGNGRTLRTYFLFLVRELDNTIVELDYSLWDNEDKENLIRGTMLNSINGSTLEIEKCFDKVLIYKKKKVMTLKKC